MVWISNYQKTGKPWDSLDYLFSTYLENVTIGSLFDLVSYCLLTSQVLCFWVTSLSLAGVIVAFNVACRWHNDHSTLFSLVFSLFLKNTLNSLLNTQQHKVVYSKCSASCKDRAWSECSCWVADKPTLLTGRADDTDKDSNEIKKSCQVAVLGGNTSEKHSSLLSDLFVVLSRVRVGKNRAM